MNVLVDTSPLKNQNAIRGIGRYTIELVQALRSLQTPHTFFTSDQESKDVDIIHYPFFDLFFATLPLIKKAKTIVTIHDVTPLVFPTHYPRGIRGQLKFLYQKLALTSVSHVITDSHCSKRDIIEHLKLKPEMITPIPLAASPVFQKQSVSVIEDVRRKYALPKNYCLYVGDINYNKNLPFLVSVMSHIPDITLVLVGKTVTNTTTPEGQEIARAIEVAGNGKYVKLLDSVDSQDDLVALYSGAKVYVQPSLYEGFGLPVIEAMRCKVTVVSSCGGSLAEVVSDAGIQFNPRDPKGCEAAIRRVLRMSDEDRGKMVKKAHEYGEQFTWERTARETLAVYEKVMKY